MPLKGNASLIYSSLQCTLKVSTIKISIPLMLSDIFSNCFELTEYPYKIATERTALLTCCRRRAKEINYAVINKTLTKIYILKSETDKQSHALIVCCRAINFSSFLFK